MKEAETARVNGLPTVGKGVGRDLAGLVVLAVVSLGLGSLFNLFRHDPLPWVYRSRAQTLDRAVAQFGEPSPASGAEVAPIELPHEIRLDEFQSFVSERKGIVLDARPVAFYREAHVPGALSLPRETFAESYRALRATLEASKERPVTVYCSGPDCPDSQLVSDALAKLGYRRLLIYTSGWEEWSQTGLPQEGVSAPP